MGDAAGTADEITRLERAISHLAELHKNTVQYRVRKAEESLGRPVGGNRHDVELALQASHWLGSYVLRPAAAGHE